MNLTNLCALDTITVILIVIGALFVLGVGLLVFALCRRSVKKQRQSDLKFINKVKAEPEAEETETPVLAEEEPAVEEVTEVEPEPEVAEIEPEPAAEEELPATAEATITVDEAVEEVAAPKDKVRYIVIKYKKSFTAKLIQSSDTTKDYYTQIKNELLSYKGVKNRISWRYETFNAGRQKIAKISLRGKSLALFLALDPKEYADSKYVIADKSEVAAYRHTPLLYRIKNDRRVRYSKELIALAMDGRAKTEGYESHDYKPDYPYEETQPLIDRGLIKVLTDDDAQSGNTFKPAAEADPESDVEVVVVPVADVEPEVAEIEPEPVIAEEPPVISEATITVDEAEEEDEVEEVTESVKEVTTPKGEVRYIVIKYKKSFTAKLIQSSDITKDYYTQIKNELLSYKGVKNRISWRYETFNAGRQKIAKISLRGKSLALFLALDPKEYADSKYVIADKSGVAAYRHTPLLYRIKNDRRVRYSKELIALAMDGRAKAEGYESHDYKPDYPYEETQPLIDRKLIKVLTDDDAQSGNTFKPRAEVTVNEVNELIEDEVAVNLITESDEYSDKRKPEIINVDVLRRFFNDGETVTLEEIKKRVPDFPKNATCIKVLARGYLDKKLTVIADSFSIEAAKMILLTGGDVVRKKVK